MTGVVSGNESQAICEVDVIDSSSKLPALTEAGFTDSRTSHYHEANSLFRHDISIASTVSCMCRSACTVCGHHHADYDCGSLDLQLLNAQETVKILNATAEPHSSDVE
jgi:hypothetical protein